MTDPTPETTPTRDEAVLSAAEIERIIDAYVRVRVDFPSDLTTVTILGKDTAASSIANRLASAPAPASGRVDAVRALPYLVHLARQRWDGNWSYTLGELAERWVSGQFHNDAAESDAKAASLSPAATPVQTANCCHCGRIIDTRETTQGGDEFGAELSDGRWTCSPECWDAVVEPAATPVSDAGGDDWMQRQKDRKQREVEIMQEYRWGNLTPLGVANHLKRAGFNIDYAIKASNALAKPASSPAGGDVVPGLRAEIAHDGFAGDIIGRYVTREGKRGAVVQQDGTRVVHVYGEKWLPVETQIALSQSTSAGRVGE